MDDLACAVAIPSSPGLMFRQIGDCDSPIRGHVAQHHPEMPREVQPDESIAGPHLAIAAWKAYTASASSMAMVTSSSE